MTKIKIGIIKEGKVPIDKRVAITPEQAKLIKAQYPDVDVVCQRSNIRCYSDQDYDAHEIKLVDDVSDCDILFGVKEVPKDQLIDGKTYFFFSHTIKKQVHNRSLLQEIIRRKIRLIDYECLTNQDGQRVIAFGRYAGIVGAYNGIWAYAKRYNLFHLRRAHECFDLDDLRTEFGKVNLPPIKIILTGGGRVAKGAMEVLLGMGIRRVSPAQFLSESFPYPVFVQLNSRDYHVHKHGGEFDRTEFYQHPDRYESDFLKYAKKAELLIAAAYWDPRAPVLFSKHDASQSDFYIKVIADVTCDIDGSIPSTLKATTIADPLYDYEPSRGTVEPALSEEGNITVMSIDNLPCELPRNASTDFGNMLIDNVLPYLLTDDTSDPIIAKATIAEKGALTSRYQYLQDYVGQGG